MATVLAVLALVPAVAEALLVAGHVLGTILLGVGIAALAVTILRLSDDEWAPAPRA